MADKNTVLIVDDESINLMVLERILNTEYTCYKASSGEDALKIAKTLLPDVILLDVMMPDLTGFEIIKILKQDTKTDKIPVIFVTGLNNFDDEEEGFKLGAADYINKPFSSAIVKLRVKNQIEMLNNVREVQRLSVTDTLTNIGNRRHFNTILQKEWNAAVESASNFGFIILDADRFKKYNDTYGHINGDIVLKDIAGLMQEVVKNEKHIARWGGEEFAVIMPSSDIDAVRSKAEALRKIVEEHSFITSENKTTRVTISLGVHSVVPKGSDSLESFISDADKALYHAKSSGRNRVASFSEV